jgi:predicted MPP superfamily phosphohydrolase
MQGVFVVVIYNLLVLFVVSGALLLLWKGKSQPSTLRFVLLGVFLISFSFASALYSPINIFGKVQLCAWATFVHCPLFLVAGARLLYAKKRAFAVGCIALAAVILIVGVDAFLIEPQWLEVTRTTIFTDKLQAPVRVAVIADLQTDAPGHYEERVFQLVASEKPDLILLVGDYLQIAQYEPYVAKSRVLNKILRRVGLDAPLGVHAVRGNVDRPGKWCDIFAGLPITLFEKSAKVDLGPLVLTGLTLRDSFDTALFVEAQEKFHVVFGHSPNFSLGAVNADLLIAGHTHGGQVRIPFWGPGLRGSDVPRSWASGVTMIAPGKMLIVSRGVGRERQYAPPMRFLCRPELVMLDLVPSPG